MDSTRVSISPLQKLEQVLLLEKVYAGITAGLERFQALQERQLQINTRLKNQQNILLEHHRQIDFHLEIQKLLQHILQVRKRQIDFYLANQQFLKRLDAVEKSIQESSRRLKALQIIK